MGGLWQVLAAAALAVTAVPAPSSTVVVPALVGQSVDSAGTELAGRGLRMTVVSGPDAAASVIDRQKPDPGTEVAVGRTITVTTKAAAVVAPPPPPPPTESASLAPWLIATSAGLGTFVILLGALVLLRRKPTKKRKPEMKKPSPSVPAPRYAVRVQPRVSPAVVHLRDPWTLS